MDAATDGCGAAAEAVDGAGPRPAVILQGSSEQDLLMELAQLQQTQASGGGEEPPSQETGRVGAGALAVEEREAGAAAAVPALSHPSLRPPSPGGDDQPGGEARAAAPSPDAAATREHLPEFDGTAASGGRPSAAAAAAPSPPPAPQPAPPRTSRWARNYEALCQEEAVPPVPWLRGLFNQLPDRVPPGSTLKLHLSRLRVAAQPLKALDAAAAADGVAALEEAPSSPLSARDVRVVGRMLRWLPVTHLDLSGHSFDDDAFAVLCDAVESAACVPGRRWLEGLSLGGCDLSACDLLPPPSADAAAADAGAAAPAAAPPPRPLCLQARDPKDCLSRLLDSSVVLSRITVLDLSGNARLRWPDYGDLGWPAVLCALKELKLLNLQFTGERTRER